MMNWKDYQGGNFSMKAKINRWAIAVLHITVPAVFLLLQGCTTGDAPVSWLNWPYGTGSRARYAEPVMFPSSGYNSMTQPVPVILPPEPVVTEPAFINTIPADSTVYVVKKGDTLSAIASMYGTSWKKLAAFNNLSDPNRLLVGQEIRIPASLGSPRPINSSSPEKSYSSPRSSIKQGTSYVIQRGDTLSGISRRSGVSVAELKVVNGLSGSRIIAGKSLMIPKDGTVNIAAASKPKQVSTVPAAVVPAPAPMADVKSPVVEAAPVAVSTTAPVYEHVLYPGETLDDVARQYGSSKVEIMTLNNISAETVIKPGIKLMVPIPE
jgi:LysM repeat protein